MSSVSASLNAQPLFGYSTAVTLCGFVYASDVLIGWAIAACGCVLGATLAFVCAAQPPSALTIQTVEEGGEGLRD